MTDKEFKRLSRAELIDIIYQLQLREEELLAENEKLKEELTNKRIKLEQAGNIAEAALEINKVMQAAQAAAEQYLEEIRLQKAETAEYCKKVMAEAEKRAAAIVANAEKTAD